MQRLPRNLVPIASILAALMAISACSVMPPKAFPREHQVDLDQYMGKWYVIAHIAPWTTNDAYNIVERYERKQPGVIATTLQYRDDGFDGAANTSTPTGYVVDGTGNAVWGMQFFWPIEMEYTIAHVDSDYRTTIVARSDRDYVWIMARQPQISDTRYQQLVQRVNDLGYDLSDLRKVPQQPMAERSGYDQSAP